MALMTAALPESARSIISPPWRGRRITRLPGLSSTPSRRTWSRRGLSSSRCQSSSFMAQTSQGSVQFLELLGRHHFGSFENLAGAVVAMPHFQFLSVGHGHDPKRENFVDFEAVAEVAGALPSDL